jgi:MOSC domain-containing protein YiiM
MTIGRLRTVNVVHQIVPDPLGSVGRTAIDKRPVSGPVEVEYLGVVGDTNLDRADHGGRDQAVYAYASEDLAAWAQRLGRSLTAGTFGENLTTEGLDVTGAVIGERWVVDGAAGGQDVVLQVTSPRIPCVTFQAWMDETHWVKRFTDAGAPGTYLRVLQEGRVAAGSAVHVVDRPGHGVTVGEVFRLAEADPERLRRLVDEGEDLHPRLVERVTRRLNPRLPSPAVPG